MEVDLFDPNAAPGPRPAWRVIEAARRRYLTGQLVLETSPVTNVYLRDGQVYFAERSTDGGLAVRLLVEGVLTRAQMQTATLQVSGVEHLGRMFERDETIDRDAVELCIELMTDDVLTGIADTPVEQWTMKMYQRHPSGIDRWLPTRVEVITHLVDSAQVAAPDALVVEAPAVARPKAKLTPPPTVVTGEVPVVAGAPLVAGEPRVADRVAAEDTEIEPTVVAPASVTARMDAVMADEVTVEAVAQHDLEMTSLHADLIAQADAVVSAHAHGAETPDPADGAAAIAAPAPVVFAPIPAPFGAPVSTQVPIVDASQAAGSDVRPTDEAAASPEDPPIGLAPSAMEALMSGSIKDEVAEAVRRALASIDH